MLETLPTEREKDGFCLQDWLLRGQKEIQRNQCCCQYIMFFLSQIFKVIRALDGEQPAFMLFAVLIQHSYRPPPSAVSTCNKPLSILIRREKSSQLNCLLSPFAWIALPLWLTPSLELSLIFIPKTVHKLML